MTKTTSAEKMQCMELWGGNRKTDRSFEMPGLRAWIYSQPFENSDRGGDVYFLSSCASGRITRILLADISGHGDEAAELGVSLRDLMRNNVNFVSQSRMVEQLNRQFGAHAVKGEFASALLATYFAPTKNLTLSNAGHPTPFLFDSAKAEWFASRTTATHHAGISNIPLGIVDQTTFDQTTFRLQHGDLFLCFSDGLIECATESGNQLGLSGLLDVINDLDRSNPAHFIPDLLARISQLSEGNLTADDVSVMLFQATESSTSFQDNILAPFRLLRPVTDSTDMSGQ
ncbi:MAG: sigma-B regulation protein RsbU (phosphoserine phosphatase) [Pirellulaceae bacterium]|jgi:sigma-B regulation protein RsbU (phosphoserine phosphatase)